MDPATPVVDRSVAFAGTLSSVLRNVNSSERASNPECYLGALYFLRASFSKPDSSHLFEAPVPGGMGCLTTP